MVMFQHFTLSQPLNVSLPRRMVVYHEVVPHVEVEAMMLSGANFCVVLADVPTALALAKCCHLMVNGQTNDFWKFSSFWASCPKLWHQCVFFSDVRFLFL